MMFYQLLDDCRSMNSLKRSLDFSADHQDDFAKFPMELDEHQFSMVPVGEKVLFQPILLASLCC